MERVLKVFFLLAAAGVVLALLAGAALFLISGGRPVDFVQTELIRFRLSSRQDDLNRPIGSDDSPIRFTVNTGDSPRTIAQNLLNNSVISDDELFVDYVRVTDLDVELEAGTYFLNQTQTIPEIAVTLTDSRSSFIPFRILEGWRMEEVADAIDRNQLFGFTGDDFLQVVRGGAGASPDFAAQVGLPAGASFEGFLYPDTYQLPPDITPVELLDTLLQTFTSRVEPQLWADAATQGWSMYDAVTLASIVERESVHPEENPQIAGVYRNRIDIGMKLDADPTVQYGIGFQNGSWWPQITQDDYVTAVSNYNTYLVNGLPPGPIASPSLSAIRAAIYPAASEFLYFRATCNGSGFHNFARTFEEHVANGCS
ncbi:MAG: endolytic transglycosylase MltG [Anaerolineae bacterium]|nr:endolytic transglycosylase MltG [Anaerolineae bacterium]